MGNALGTLFSEIANAIRGKTGSTDTMKPAEFPDAIDGIECGVVSDELNELIDEINGEIISGVVVTFVGSDGFVLCEVTVAPGYDCPNPVTTGLISKPTKESSQTEVFNYSGWSMTEGGAADSSALVNVTENRTVYAAFTASTRYYAVRFYDGEKLITTEQIPYGGSSEYVYDKTGAYFQGWTPEPTNITSDMDCYGEWVMAAFAADSWETIQANALSGTASEYYAVGDERELTFAPDGSNETIVLQVAGFTNDTVLDADGNEVKSGIVIIAKTPLKTPRAYSTTSKTLDGQGEALFYTTDGFRGSDIATYLEDVVLPALPAALKNAIRPTMKVCNAYDPSTYFSAAHGYYGSYTDAFNLWLPSRYEVGKTLPSGIDDGTYPRYGIYFTLLEGQITENLIKTPYGETESVKWWLRDISGNQCAEVMTAAGELSQANIHVTNTEPYVVFGFCI